MIRNGKYRFTLQFGMNTMEEQTAGTILEQLGKKKSPIVVAALYEYYQRHPELQTGNAVIQFHMSAPDTHMLEDRIRKLIEERLSTGDLPMTQQAITAPEVSEQVRHDDILDMLNDLDCFS